MDDMTDHAKAVRTPEDLRGTALDRREYLRLLGGGSALVLSSSLAGCTGSGGSGGDTGGNSSDGASGSSGSGSVPEELVLARAGDSEALDPHVTTASYSEQVMSLIYDPLVTMDFEGNFSPGLGKEWQVNDAGTEWTIELNDGISFHNGDAFTADDVVFTYNRLLNKPALLKWAVGPMSGVEATGENSVTFTFDEKYAPWNTYSSYGGYFGIIPRGPVEADEDAFAANPVGTGPYKLDEWVRGDHITLTRNDEWSTPHSPEIESEDAPLPKKITFRVIPEELPRVQALLSGDVDILLARDFPQRELSTIQDDSGTTAEVFTSNNAGYVAFNVQQAPTDDVTVRKALAHAIDKERIIEDIYQGLGAENWVPFSENLLGWAGEDVRDQLGYEFDPEKAGQLLDDAGWTMDGEFRSKDGERLTIDIVSTNTPPPRVQTAEEMVSMFADVGIEAELTTYEYNTAYDEFGKGESNVMYGTVSWFDTDIVNFLWGSANAGASNLSFLEDPEVDEMIAKGATSIDAEEREAAYRELQLKVMEMCPCQPVMTYEQATGLQTAVQNYKQHPSLLTPVYHDVTLDE